MTRLPSSYIYFLMPVSAFGVIYKMIQPTERHRSRIFPCFCGTLCSMTNARAEVLFVWIQNQKSQKKSNDLGRDLSPNKSKAVGYIKLQTAISRSFATYLPTVVLRNVWSSLYTVFSFLHHHHLHLSLWTTWYYAFLSHVQLLMGTKLYRYARIDTLSLHYFFTL